jgi:dihydrofolate reductase
MKIIIIAALSDNYVIGDNNKLPWRLPADLKRFKLLTLGKPVIMGRKTYEAIGKALPGRRNIVLSRNKNFIPVDCEVYSSLALALVAVGSCSEVFIIGGAEIYKQALQLTDIMYLTLVHNNFAGDSYFPRWDSKEWEIVECENSEPNENNIYSFSFMVLKRKIEN